MVGYSKDLFILPFDHRASFLKGIFGIEDRKPTDEEIEKVKQFKKIIYEGFKKAIEKDIPQESAAILVDPQFGSEILLDARQNGFTTILTTEKSGVDSFALENPDSLVSDIKHFRPAFLKALVRYNVEGDQDINKASSDALSDLTVTAYKNSVRLLIEPLIPATDTQLAKVNGDKERFDNEIRPELTIRMIKELQDNGVNPDVWKLEGLNDKNDYENVVKQARFSGRDSVGVVVLGRGAGKEIVENWVRIGATVNGVIGFAVGRTIFWDPLKDYKEGKINENDASDKISENFIHFYKIFIESRDGILK